MATASQLQAQVEEVAQLCPTLAPAILPRGQCSADLAAMMGGSSKALKASASQLAKHTGACTICGRTLSSATAPGAEDDEEGNEEEEQAKEAGVGRLAADWRLDFAGRRIRLAGVHLACGLCRGLQDTAAVVQLLAAEAAGRLPDAAAEAALLLQQHMARVNLGAGHAVAADPQAAAHWCQDVFRRAYSLQVVASSLRGWQLADGSGAGAEDEGQGQGQVLSAAQLPAAVQAAVERQLAASGAAKLKPKLKPRQRVEAAAAAGAAAATPKQKKAGGSSTGSQQVKKRGTAVAGAAAGAKTEPPKKKARSKLGGEQAPGRRRLSVA